MWETPPHCSSHDYVVGAAVKASTPLPANTIDRHHSPNHTNLHVHGLHVSPLPPADDVYRAAGPGETINYSYVIPTNHPAGTFYYHPPSVMLRRSAAYSARLID